MRLASSLVACAFYTLPLAAQAHEGGHDARGRVTAVGPQQLTIKTSRGAETFALTPGTEFVKEGEPATAQDLKEGDRVVVHAKKKAGKAEAIQVQMAPPAKKKQ